MKCNRIEPCSDCPFLKSNQENLQVEIKTLVKQGLAESGRSCSSTEELSFCAGAIIFASLSNKIFKNKKLRFYQVRLGKHNSVLSKQELLILKRN